MNNEKLVKNSKTVWAVLKIFEVCCIIGVAVIIVAEVLFANICKAVSYVFLKESFDFDRIFNKSVVADCSYDFDLDIGFIVAALVVFMLAYVFSYGESLQIESDETL